MPPIVIAAGIAAGGAIAGGVMGMKGANKQAEAAKSASQVQWDMYQQDRRDHMPWINAGGKAITTLGDMVAPGGDLYNNFTAADFQKDPGYDFRMAEGAKALERSAAARGSVLGGGTLKALDRYNQDFASNEFGNAYNRFQQNRTSRYNQLAGVAGAGQISANTVTQAGQNTAARIGENTLQAGNARASGYAALTNGITGAGNSIMNAYLMSKMYPSQSASSQNVNII